MTFADTGALFAVLVPSDENHRAARAWLRANKRTERLVTTDYVLDELLTLLRARLELDRARVTAKAAFLGRLAQVQWVGREHARRGAEVFDEYADKQWSFTDCVSYAVIEQLRITRAFSFDEHFHQFGTVEVVP